MPGLTFYLNYNRFSQDQLTQSLLKLQMVYKVPTLKYSEDYLIGDSFLVYSCAPDFIREPKLLRINDNIVGLDGDFYNENELMNYLNQRNLSKLEIIYYLFMKEGSNFAKLINGEFNILIFDTLKKELLSTNDRFARKPFYYKKTESEIIFSSEKKGILSLSENKNSLDYIGIFQVVALEHSYDRRTFISEIKRLKPADVLLSNNRKISINPYFTWKFNTDINLYKRSELIDEMYNKLRKSLEIRLANKKRIILWLSGGFDSRSLALSISKEKRGDIKVESYGENFSEELVIAESLCEILGYDFTKRTVQMSYSNIGKIGTWRTEFALVPFEHPHVSFHNEMKLNSDYLIGGLPGFDVLNGGTIPFGIIYGSIFRDYIFKWFQRYLRLSYNELIQIFGIKNVSAYYPELFKSFEITLNKIDIDNKIDKWDVFMIYERQPNFSNISDMYDADLFETLHPFCDIDLANTFLKVPIRTRIFQQLSKDMISKYYPEVMDIPLDGRGKMLKNNSLTNILTLELVNRYRYYFVKAKFGIWNRKLAFQNDLFIIKNDIKRIFDYPELIDLLNKDFLESAIASDSLLVENFIIVEKIISILYAYESFINTTNITIPSEVIKYYE